MPGAGAVHPITFVLCPLLAFALPGADLAKTQPVLPLRDVS